jgi:hypothetical protein
MKDLPGDLGKEMVMGVPPAPSFWSCCVPNHTRFATVIKLGDTVHRVQERFRIQIKKRQKQNKKTQGKMKPDGKRGKIPKAVVSTHGAFSLFSTLGYILNFQIKDVI